MPSFELLNRQSRSGRLASVRPGNIGSRSAQLSFRGNKSDAIRPQQRSYAESHTVKEENALIGMFDYVPALILPYSRTRPSTPYLGPDRLPCRSPDRCANVLHMVDVITLYSKPGQACGVEQHRPRKGAHRTASAVETRCAICDAGRVIA